MIYSVLVIGFILILLSIYVIWQTRPVSNVVAVLKPQMKKKIKCHIKTFTYLDEHTEVRHSYCFGKVGLDNLTDEKAQTFHTVATLIGVTNSVHEVEI